MTTEAIIAALAWSLGGFIGGFMAGRATSDIGAIKEELVDTPKQIRLGFRWLGHRPGLGVLLILMAILTVASSGLAIIRDGEQTRCQADVNARLYEVLNERSDVVDVERNATDELITVVFESESGSDGADTQAAYAKYRKALDASNAARERYTYPTVKEFRC